MRFVRYFTHKVDFVSSKSAICTLFHAQSGLHELKKCDLYAISRTKWTFGAFPGTLSGPPKLGLATSEPKMSNGIAGSHLNCSLLAELKKHEISGSVGRRFWMCASGVQNVQITRDIPEKLLVLSPKCANYSRHPLKRARSQSKMCKLLETSWASL